MWVAAVTRSEYVEQILADSLLQLPSIRTMRAANPRYRHTEQHSRIMGGVIGMYVNAVPFLHLWRLRDHRFEKVFLGTCRACACTSRLAWGAPMSIIEMSSGFWGGGRRHRLTRGGPATAAAR